jgi:superfamily I DNA/RNA helicase
LALSRTDQKYYLSKEHRLYYNRLAKFLDSLNGLNEVNNRLEKYFDSLYIDEIQDFAGHDFNFLKSISKADIEILMVGDYFQHTFDTSNDGNVNKNIYNDLNTYIKNLSGMGLFIDTKTLIKSYRCSPTVCGFLQDSIGIGIYSHRTDETAVLHVIEKRSADEIFSDEKIVKLFYSEHYKYGLYSNNWGNSKGLNRYNDVCVIMNKTTNKLFNANKLEELNPQTKNKFYVACTRARNNLYFISDELLKNKKS